MNWSALDWGILGPPLIAGLLVLATHVPLGMQVLDRGIVFIDLAIAQIAGLGVIAADALGLPEGGVAVQAAAVSAALLGAALLTWTERRAAQQQEALIGVMFILAACAGILLLAGNPHGGEHLKDLLVGQILWVDGAQLALARAACRRSCCVAAARWRHAALRPLRLLWRVRAGGHRVGATGRRVPGVLEPDHSGARDARVQRPATHGGRLRDRRRRLRARAGAVGAVRPAVGRGDRLDAGRLWFSRGSGTRPARGALNPALWWLRLHREAAPA